MPAAKRLHDDVDSILPQVEDHIEALIDEALQETFPASDPPAPAVATAIQLGSAEKKAGHE